MEFVDQSFVDKDVILDGNSFIRCTFRRVTFSYSAIGKLDITQCTFDDCQWMFDGPAANTLTFMSGVYNGMGDGGRDVIDRTFDNVRAGAPFGDQGEVPAITVKPKIFIGHGRSSEYALLQNYLMGEGFEVETFESKPRAGLSAKEVVESMARRASMAFLVHTAEDEQNGKKVRARENVVHETGLFQGMLGFGRAIVLREEGCEPFSNLDGIQYISFGTGNIKHAFLEVTKTIGREFPTAV